MLDDILAALADSGLAVTLRGSFWLYPLVNTVHIAGLALLFGGILPLDLRLIGLWPTVPLATLSRVLLPIAIGGLILVLVTGPLMFIVQPQDYAANPYFQIKLALIAAAVVNALSLRLVPAWRNRDSGAARASAYLPLAGMLSIGLWLGAIFCGRMIGFY
jgi:hypothetical protein